MHQTTAYNCEPLIASVLSAEITPAATCLICLTTDFPLKLGLPTDTTPHGVPPAKLTVVPAIAILGTFTGETVAT